MSDETGRRRAKRPVLPAPASGRQLIANLDELIANRPKRQPLTPFVAAFRAKEPFVLGETELDSIVERLTFFDPSWAAHLVVVSKELPRPKSGAAEQLRNALTYRASEASDFPEHVDASDDSRTIVMAWVARRAHAGPEQRPAAMLALALRTVRRATFYPDALFVCLEGRAASSRKVFDRDSFEQAISAALTQGGKQIVDEARERLAVAAYVERDRARMAQSFEAITAAYERLKEKSAGLQERIGELGGEVASLRAEASRLAVDAQRSERDAANTAREGQSAAANAAGRLRVSTLSVLALETAQLREYLDRPSPNVVDALESVRHLEELRDQLTGG